MSSSTLAASIAELLAYETRQRKAAPSPLSTMKCTRKYNARQEVAWGATPEAGLRAFRLPPGLAGACPAPCGKVCPAPCRAPASVDSYFMGGGDLKPQPVLPSRRSSLASTRSTMASGSSETSDMDWTDLASDISSVVPSPQLGFGRAPREGAAPPLRSSLKLSNIPRRCGKEELLEAIEAVGFANSYDFFYLPLGPQSKKNHGYAFINFQDSETADRFGAIFSGYPVRAKLLDVGPAPLQGLAANLEHFCKTQAAKGSWMPDVILKV